MIQDGLSSDNGTQTLQERIKAIGTSVEQVCSPKIFEPAASMAYTLPLSSESTQLMRQLGKDDLEKIESFRAKVARMQTDNGAAQYLLAPDLSSDEAKELVGLRRPPAWSPSRCWSSSATASGATPASTRRRCSSTGARRPGRPLACTTSSAFSQALRPPGGPCSTRTWEGGPGPMASGCRSFRTTCTASCTSSRS